MFRFIHQRREAREQRRADLQTSIVSWLYAREAEHEMGIDIDMQDITLLRTA